MRIVIIFFIILFPLSSFAQLCATPMDCYQVEQRKKEEAIRLKKEREEAQFRQQQLELQEAQLRELQEQREILEEERQDRIEKEEIEEAEKEKVIVQ